MLLISPLGTELPLTRLVPQGLKAIPAVFAPRGRQLGQKPELSSPAPPPPLICSNNKKV